MAEALETAVSPGRRRAPRAHMEVEVDFHDETTFYNGFSENISAGGVFVATYNLQELGKKISLSLTLPSGHTVRVEGTVRWLREPRDSRDASVSPGFGVQFEGLDPEAQSHIEDFVAQREPLFYDE